MHVVHESLTDWMEEADLIVRGDAVGQFDRSPAQRWRSTSFCHRPLARRITVAQRGQIRRHSRRAAGPGGDEGLAGRTFKRAVDVLAFSEEEGVRYGSPFLGSRAVIGSFDRELLQKSRCERCAARTSPD